MGEYEILKKAEKNAKELLDKKKSGSYWSIFNGDKEILHNKKNAAQTNFYQAIAALIGNVTVGQWTSTTIGSNYALEYNTGGYAGFFNITTTNNGVINPHTSPFTIATATSVTIYNNFGIINGSQSSDTITACDSGIGTSVIFETFFDLSGVSVVYNPSQALSVTQIVSVS